MGEAVTPEQFARAIADEKNNLVEAIFAPDSGTLVGQQIADLQLPAEQRELLRAIIDGALTDICYTILLGLDGATSLGGLQQQEFQLSDEEGNLLTGGELEGHAYEIFHGEE